MKTTAEAANTMKATHRGTPVKIIVFCTRINTVQENSSLEEWSTKHLFCIVSTRWYIEARTV